MKYVIKDSQGNIVHGPADKEKSDTAIARFYQDEKDELLNKSWHADGPFRQEQTS